MAQVKEKGAKTADAPATAPPPKPKDAEAPKAEKAVPPIPKATDGDKDSVRRQFERLTFLFGR